MMKICDFLILSLAVLLASCSNSEKTHSFQGFTMGTYYRVLFIGDEKPDLQSQIDSVLADVNHTFSVFDTLSLISCVNKADSLEVNSDFAKVFEVSKYVCDVTGGAFNPTVEPLVNLWGFGRDSASEVSASEVSALLPLLDFDKVYLKDNTIIKENKSIVLNFNAIAKGYGVDKVAAFLLDNGYKDFLVDIGGEIVSHGTKSGKPWQVGIQVPTKEKDGAIASDYTFPLSEAAVATSGNYRNYREENGVRYSHIINPKTGYPEKSDLLSVTVVAADCVTADALATAFMVLGVNGSMEILKQHSEWAAYFIYLKNNELAVTHTENFPK